MTTKVSVSPCSVSSHANSNGLESGIPPLEEKLLVYKQKEGTPPLLMEQTRQNDRQVIGLVSYYMAMLLLLFWFLIDVWSSNFVSLHWFVPVEALEQSLLRVMGFIAIGGALGSILYSIRTLFHYYIQNQYDPRWLGKYVTAPLEGAVLAVIVMALLQGGVALLGLPNGAQVNVMNHFALFGISSLIGYSIRAVIAWMERVTASIFGDIDNREKNTRRKLSYHD